MRFLRWLFLFILLVLLARFGSGASEQANGFFREMGGKWSFHSSSSTIAMYGRSAKKFSSPETGLRQILVQYSDLLRVAGPSDLTLISRAESSAGIHFYLQQHYAGFPVLGAEVSAHFNSRNELMALISRGRKLTGRISAPSNIRTAQATLQKLFGSDVLIAVRGLKIVPETSPRLVWHFEIEANDPGKGAWAVWMDASDSQDILWIQPLYFTFDGTGKIWQENPVTTPSRAEAKFQYLDASKSLAGKFARTFNANGTEDVSNPIVLSDYTTAKNPDRKFVYPENDLRSVEAMGYYHITRVHDRWKSLGVKSMDKRAPVFVNVAATDNGRGLDNAYRQRSNRFKSTGILVFGAGDRYENLGMDADLYYHEYGHGVLDNIRPIFLEFPQESVYSFTFHEAFSDVSAAALTGNSRIAEFGSRLRENRKFVGRNLQNTRRFPQHVIDRSIGLSEPHYASLILTGAWWDLKKRIGVDYAQRLLLEAAYLVPASADFFSVRDAMLTADESLNSGKNRAAILQSFQRHGVQGKNPGPPKNITAGAALMIGDNAGTKVVKSDFSRGSTIYLGLEYTSTGKTTPGYFLVPDALQFQKPEESNAFIQWGIPEIFSGQFQGANASVLLHVITDASTTSGTYTITFTPRVGGSDRTFGSKTVSFRIL